MKKPIIFCVMFLVVINLFAQAPERMSYQAVVRNSSNDLVTSATIGMRISILQGSINGTPVFVETQNPTSNTNGLVSLEVGSGIVLTGDFAAINWANGPYFIETEIDPSGGINYSISGTTQLLSVPYALYAQTSGSSIPGPQGPSGNDGNGIISTVDNGNGTFTFTYSDGSTFTTSDLTGPQGNVGSQGPQGVPGPQGPSGNDGNGIISTVDNGNGTFTFTYSDGSTFTTSDLTGPQGNVGSQGPQGVLGPQGPSGNDGNGIISTVDNGNGTFTFTYSDGSTFTTSDLTGPQGNVGSQGPQGVPGPQGPSGNDGNGIISTVDNGNGTFTFTYSDGSTFTTSNLTGPQGVAGTFPTYSIGDVAQGGIVFWVDPTGQHGLVLAPFYASNPLPWSVAIEPGSTSAFGDGPMSGEMNTLLIIAAQGGSSNYAALSCANLNLNSFGDWYLPSFTELDEVMWNSAIINATAIANGFDQIAALGHWSSTEYDLDTGQAYGIDNNGFTWILEKDILQAVRAVRAF